MDAGSPLLDVCVMFRCFVKLIINVLSRDCCWGPHRLVSRWYLYTGYITTSQHCNNNNKNMNFSSKKIPWTTLDNGHSLILNSDTHTSRLHTVRYKCSQGSGNFAKVDNGMNEYADFRDTLASVQADTRLVHYARGSYPIHINNSRK